MYNSSIPIHIVWKLPEWYRMLHIFKALLQKYYPNWCVRMHLADQFIYISHLNLSNNNLYLSTLHGIKKVRYCPISIMRSRCVIKYSSKNSFWPNEGITGKNSCWCCSLSTYTEKCNAYLCFITYDLDLFQQNYIAVKVQWFDCKSRKRKVKIMIKVLAYKFYFRIILFNTTPSFLLPTKRKKYA